MRFNQVDDDPEVDVLPHEGQGRGGRGSGVEAQRGYW